MPRQTQGNASDQRQMTGKALLDSLVHLPGGRRIALPGIICKSFTGALGCAGHRVQQGPECSSSVTLVLHKSEVIQWQDPSAEMRKGPIAAPLLLL